MRHRSLSPTSSPHRNSKGDGKGSDDGGAICTPKFAGGSPSSKATRLLSVNLKTRSCQKGNSCNYWHVPEYAKKIISEPDAGSETSVHTDTQLHLPVK